MQFVKLKIKESDILRLLSYISVIFVFIIVTVMVPD
jgi:hypothetical protein